MRLYRWWRRARTSLFALFLVLFALPASAQEKDAEGAASGKTPTLFLLPTQGVRDSVTSIVPERIGELLRQQIGKDDRVTLMPPYQELRQQLGGSSAAVAKAESMYTSGIGLLTAGEDEKAAETFQRAVDMMEQNLADLSNYDVLADSLANLALAYFNAGFDLDGRKKMQQYAHMRPDATLDPEKYPPELIEIYEAEAKKVNTAGPGKLTVKANREDALVYIDGVEKGKAPVTVEDVGFGYHYLVVRDPAGSVWSEKIRVRGRGKSQSFEAELGKNIARKGSDESEAGALPPFYVDLLAEIETGQFGTDLAPYLKELASQTGAQHVGWVVMYKEEGEYVAATFVYRSTDGLLVQGDGMTFNLELSNLLVGVSTLSTDLVDLVLSMPEDRAVTSVQLGEPPAEAPVAATSGGTAGQTDVELARADEEDDQIEPPPDVPPSSRKNTWTYIGATAGGLAAAGLVAGGIYLLTRDDGSPAAGFSTEVSW